MTNRLLTALVVLNLLCLLVLMRLMPKPAQQWEYQIESVTDANWDTGMKKLGDQGWELVFARRASDGNDHMSYEMIFKRPKLAVK